MPKSLPCLQSYKNIEKLFTSISAAKVPDSFGHKFLTDALGLKSTGDRPLIPFLRSLGFLDGSNKPTASYMQLKNPALKSRAIAASIKIGYAPLFDADERANERGNEDLKGLVAQVSGADTGTVSKIMGTLNGLLKLVKPQDFLPVEDADDEEQEGEEVDEQEEDGKEDSFRARRKIKDDKFQSNVDLPFHFNIQVHLPSNATEEVYLNIFNAIRKVFN